MELAQPLWLWALLLLPLLAAGEVWAVRRDRDRTARLVSRALWGRVLRRPREAWRFVRLGLLLTGAAGVIVALAQPRWGLVREKLEREGVDVVLVADTSASMSVEDVQPNRFFVARAALSSLLDRLEGGRFALVALEGEAYPLVPLTLDADAVGLFLETMEPGIVPHSGHLARCGPRQGARDVRGQEPQQQGHRPRERRRGPRGRGRSRGAQGQGGRRRRAHDRRRHSGRRSRPRRRPRRQSHRFQEGRERNGGDLRS